MSQVTVRAAEELIKRVRRAAEMSGRSMNEYISVVLDAATDPDLAGSEAERVRERLRRADLLLPLKPLTGRSRPPQEAVRAAGKRAAHGKPLSEIVREGR